MALTPSTMMPLGSIAPEFTLPDTVSGNQITLSDFANGKPVLVMFICNHCPFVKHINDELVRLGQDYESSDLNILAISSNDVTTHPEDHPIQMKVVAESLGFTFPYLYDEDQSVAKSYDAACTPDFFLFDAELKCRYRGQLDSSRPGNEVEVSGEDIRAAIDAILSGQAVNQIQTPSIGCNIKWKV